MRHTAVGLNYIDTYHRSGAYKLPLPTGIGQEAAGVVEAIGPGVTDVQARPARRLRHRADRRVQRRARRCRRTELVPLPDGVSERDAAAMMLKGLTVQYLFRQTKRLQAGDTILFHAAAGGVGLIACQWARALGVTMIGTTSAATRRPRSRRRTAART